MRMRRPFRIALVGVVVLALLLSIYGDWQRYQATEQLMTTQNAAASKVVAKPTAWPANRWMSKVEEKSRQYQVQWALQHPPQENAVMLIIQGSEKAVADFYHWFEKEVPVVVKELDAKAQADDKMRLEIIYEI